MSRRHYQSQTGDPYWITAKYNGHDANGTRFVRGERILFFPRTRSVFTGTAADKEWSQFQSAAADETFESGGLY